MDLSMKIIFTSLIYFLVLLPEVAVAEIYKCHIAGKLVFTDQPCEGEKVTLGVTNSMPAREYDFEYEPSKKAYRSHRWYYGYAGYQQALGLLKKYDAPIFIYFQADWCGYCRTLEKELINTSAGKKALKNAIKVRVSPESSAQNDAFFRQLGGTGYPSVFIQADAQRHPKKLSTQWKQGGRLRMLTARELAKIVRP